MAGKELAMFTFVLIFTLYLGPAKKVEYQYAGKHLFENQEACYKKAVAIGDGVLAKYAHLKTLKARARCSSHIQA